LIYFSSYICTLYEIESDDDGAEGIIIIVTTIITIICSYLNYSICKALGIETTDN